MQSRRWTAVVVVLALFVGGVWLAVNVRQRTNATANAASGAAPERPKDAGVARLFKTPEEFGSFTMKDVDGKPLSSADWRGKVVLVNFWATWCPPCREEIPDLIALQNKYKDRLVIIGVSEDEIPVAEVKRFVDAHGMNYPIVMTNKEIQKQFTGIAALPTTFVLDREGRLAQKHVGMLNAANTEAEARVLAGIDTTAKVEYIENNAKVRLENAVKAKSFPGVDLSKLSDVQKDAVVQALVSENCTCGCGLTLAVCRIDDPTCPISLPIAQDIVKKYSATPN
jgi:thiol-disulfide isomerase/thioredoxin